MHSMHIHSNHRKQHRYQLHTFHLSKWHAPHSVYPLLHILRRRACPRLQIEFYFSDSNLPRDAFLLSAVEEAPDGFVSLALICTFSRMRTLLELKGSEGAPLTAATVSTHHVCPGSSSVCSVITACMLRVLKPGYALVSGSPAQAPGLAVECTVT
jgi:La domain